MWAEWSQILKRENKKKKEEDIRMFLSSCLPLSSPFSALFLSSEALEIAIIDLIQNPLHDPKILENVRIVLEVLLGPLSSPELIKGILSLHFDSSYLSQRDLENISAIINAMKSGTFFSVHLEDAIREILALSSLVNEAKTATIHIAETDQISVPISASLGIIQNDLPDLEFAKDLNQSIASGDTEHCFWFLFEWACSTIYRLSLSRLSYIFHIQRVLQSGTDCTESFLKNFQLVHLHSDLEQKKKESEWLQTILCQLTQDVIALEKHMKRWENSILLGDKYERESQTEGSLNLLLSSLSSDPAPPPPLAQTENREKQKKERREREKEKEKVRMKQKNLSLEELVLSLLDLSRENSPYKNTESGSSFLGNEYKKITKQIKYFGERIWNLFRELRSLASFSGEMGIACLMAKIQDRVGSKSQVPEIIEDAKLKLFRLKTKEIESGIVVSESMKLSLSNLVEKISEDPTLQISQPPQSEKTRKNRGIFN